MKTLSIISPVYQNEHIETFVREIHEKIIKRFKANFGDVEFIIGEDGSTDRTREILKGIQRKYDLTLNLCDQKRGYLKAAKELYAQASGKYVFFTDSDGEHDANDFWKLWEKFQRDDLDIVLGYKTKRTPLHRVAVSKVNNVMLGILFNVWLRDANCGFRIMKTEVSKKIIPLTGHLSVATNAEALIVANKLGYKYAEVPVKHIFQPSTVFPLRKLPKTYLKGFTELFYMRSVLNRIK